VNRKDSHVKASTTTYHPTPLSAPARQPASSSSNQQPGRSSKKGQPCARQRSSAAGPGKRTACDTCARATRNLAVVPRSNPPRPGPPLGNEVVVKQHYGRRSANAPRSRKNAAIGRRRSRCHRASLHSHVLALASRTHALRGIGACAASELAFRIRSIAEPRRRALAAGAARQERGR